jgi:hypothetical protein
MRLYLRTGLSQLKSLARLLSLRPIWISVTYTAFLALTIALISSITLPVLCFYLFFFFLKFSSLRNKESVKPGTVAMFASEYKLLKTREHDVRRCIPYRLKSFTEGPGSNDSTVAYRTYELISG